MYYIEFNGTILITLEGVSSLNNLIDLLNIFHQSNKLPVFLFNKNFDLIKSFKLAVTPNFPDRYFKKIDTIDLTPNSRIYIVDANESFSVIRTTSSLYAYIVIWVNSSTVEQTGYYQDRFPVIGVERLLSYTKLLFFSIYQKFPNLNLPNNMADPSDALISDLDDDLLDDSSNTIQHNSYFNEMLMVNAVEHANLAEFDIRLSQYIKSGSYGEMATVSEHRNKKDLALAATTLFTRAAIRGGLTESLAFQLSDECCKQIENRTSIISVSNLIQEIGSLFIKKMIAYSSRPGYILIYKIKNYIYDNHHNKLSLSDLANSLGYSKEYLCKIFKKSTNKTIIEYYNSQRIQEAESLLIYTNKTIGEISEDLGFNDQSYFTKMFIQQKSTTPNKFRRHYHI